MTIDDPFFRSKTVIRCPDCLREKYETNEPWIPKEQSQRGPHQPIIWIQCPDCQKIKEAQNKYKTTKPDLK